MKARLPKGMGNGPANMQHLMKQAQKMQEEMEAKQAELDEMVYDIQAGGGAVTVKINGKLEVLFTTYTENNQTAQRGSLYVLDCTGKVLSKVTLPIRWGASADNTNQPNGSMATPCVADLDGDGKMEIAVTSLYSGVIVYDVG